MAFIILTSKNFEKYVLKNEKIVVVLFYAIWSGLTHILKPVIKETEIKYREYFVFCKLDIDRYNDIAKKYRVVELPTLLIFKNGEVIDSLHGTFSLGLIEQKLSKLLTSANYFSNE